MGSVSTTPTTTDTIMPMKKGRSSVAHMTILPKAEAALPTGAAIRAAAPIPIKIVTIGVTRMSTLVSLLTALPNSEAMIATKNTAKGPPAPPMALVAKPTGTNENSTMAGHWSA